MDEKDNLQDKNGQPAEAEQQNTANQQGFTSEFHLPKWTVVSFAIAFVAIMVAGGWMFIKDKSAEPVQPDAVVDTSEGKVHYLGILHLRNPSEMLARFAGVEHYLRENTGLNIKLRLYPTSGDLGGYSAVVRDVANGDVSFAYLASVTTVQAHGNGPVIPFACAQKFGSPTYRGDLVVRDDSPYYKLEDLKGKKVAGTSKSSTSGNLMPSAMLKSEGIDKETYFEGGMKYLGSHDKAVQAVIAGTVDACFINEATFNKYKAENPIRSIWRHDPVPEFPFVVNTEKVTPEELALVKDALLKMHETNLESIKSVNENHEKWVSLEWEDCLDIKAAIDDVYGEVFYNLDEW